MDPVVGQSCDWYNIPCHLSSFSTWLKEILLYVPRKVYALLLDGLATVIEALPVPDAVSSVATLYNGIAPGIQFFLSGLHIPGCLAIIAGAYLTRFIIRRLPFVG